MKAKDYNGTIKTFPNVPKSYGKVIGGFDLLSDSDLEAYGFYDLVTPSFSIYTQELGGVIWDSKNNQFTYSLSDRTWSETLSELKISRITQAKEKARKYLSSTDWYVTRRAETGTEIPSDIQTQRNDIRTNCTNHEQAINSKSTKAQVMSYLIE